MMNAVGRQHPPFRLLMSADSVGGVFTYALDIARGLAAYGVSTTLALLGPSASAAQKQSAAHVPGLEIVDTGLPLDWMTDDRSAVERTPHVIASLANRLEADVAHLNSPSLARAAYACPVVVGLHSCLATWWRAVKRGPMPEDFHWRTEATAEGLQHAALCVCPTAAFAAEAAQVYGNAPLAVHNGRAVHTPGPAPGDSGAFAFAAGRFWDEGKGFTTLLDAAPLIDIPVIAAGPLAGPNGAQVTAHGVVALGSVDQKIIRQRLAQRPVFVSTAVYEPFGLSVLEAAQAGCPLVLSDIATFRELWDGAAVFVRPGDAAAFASAVNELAADAQARERLADAARHRAGRYTIEAMAGEMMRIYEGLVAARGRDAG